jgi:hypothetical protein
MYIKKWGCTGYFLRYIKVVRNFFETLPLAIPRLRERLTRAVAQFPKQ